MGGWGVGLLEIKAKTAKLSLVLFELGLSLAKSSNMSDIMVYLATLDFLISKDPPALILNFSRLKLGFFLIF